MTRGECSQIQGLYLINRDSVPVIVAFTKSDMTFPQISESKSGDSQFQDRAKSRAYAQCDQLCRPLFRKEPRDVPAELVSGDYSLLLGMAL